MKKIILLSLLFVCIIGVNIANAQKKDKGKIEPQGIECDKIYVTASQNGKIKFSEPVNLVSIGLVDKITGEIVQDLPLSSNGSNSIFKTVELYDYELDFDIILKFELIQDRGTIVINTVLEPCSRQIVIGQK